MGDLASRLTDEQMADLCALADGTLPPDRRPLVEGWVATSPELQQLGIEGAVLLRAVISVDGSLLNLEVANTDVNAGLAKAALDAVKQWRYQPTLLNGQPVEVVTTITVDFRLER